MTKRIAFINWHSVSEHDHIRLFHELGYEVVSLGAYLDPAHPGDNLRPPLPQIPVVTELQDALADVDAAKQDIPDALLEWLGDDGIIVQEHYLHHLYAQWWRLGEWRKGGTHRRIIRRTCGQSVQADEETAAYYQKQGLERVAYSPKEANIPGFAGQDALIRFYADPEEWGGWNGDTAHVLNVYQDLVKRDPFSNGTFALSATQGLPRSFMGSGSEALGGPGVVPEDEMKRALRNARAYIYTGTQPASYTLGFIEAAMTGVPIVSVGPAWMQVFRYGPDLFEGHELAWRWSDSPETARGYLAELLTDPALAAEASRSQRAKALATFDKATVMAQWKAFLG